MFRKRWIVALLVLAAPVVSGAGQDPPTREADELRIHFLNVGAGNCAIVECPGPDAPPMVVDCGTLSRTASDMTRTQARTYIQGVLDDSDFQPNVVLSHGHTDHYGWIATVLGNLQVDTIWLGGTPDRYSLRGFPDWRDEQEMGGADVHEDFPANFHNDGDALADLSCGLAETSVLTVNTPGSENAHSLVLRIDYNDFSIIFSGDAEGSTEQQAISNNPDGVDATVVAASHHGSRSHGSNSTAWVQATDPEVVIFSAGEMFRHPRCEAVSRYRSLLATTDEHAARCGIGSRYIPFDTEEAQFTTEVSGRLVLTTDGASPLAVHCSTSDECRVSIPY